MISNTPLAHAHSVLLSASSPFVFAVRSSSVNYRLTICLAPLVYISSHTRPAISAGSRQAQARALERALWILADFRAGQSGPCHHGRQFDAWKRLPEVNYSRCTQKGVNSFLTRWKVHFAEAVMQMLLWDQLGEVVVAVGEELKVARNNLSSLENWNVSRGNLR